MSTTEESDAVAAASAAPAPSVGEKTKSGLQRLFGSKGEAATEGSGDPLIRKTKSFKRIRGLLSGDSRKERREKKKAAKAAGVVSAAGAGGTAPADDASTIYQVDVDERSVLTSRSTPTVPGALGEAKAEGGVAVAPETPKKPYLLKVVLLLMDPDTRRFELLQLEFDSLKALVSDVLSQIPVSVTEESLRVKMYAGITGRDGVEYRPDQLLSGFCKGNDILVAVPVGVTAKDCSRLARPILSDDKVVSMLLSSGIDAKAWREKKKKRRSNPKTTRALDESDAAPAGTSSTKTITILVVVLAAIALQVFHMYISTAIKPGHIVSPGIWLTKCGILGMLPPPVCDSNEKLEYGDDGMVTLRSPDGTPLWEMQGGVCPADDATCTPGMQVKEDNTIVIGGKTVYTVRLFDANAELSPWPFAEPPKVSIRLSKKY